MRAGIFLLLIAFTFTTFSQSYVNAGIQHYNLGQFEEANADFIEAEQMKKAFTPSAIGMLHFYQAMTNYKMTDIGSLRIQDVKSILSDFQQAVKIDSAHWYQESKEVRQMLAAEVNNRASRQLKYLRKIADTENRVAKSLYYIELLELVKELNQGAQVERLMASAYHEMGDWYFDGAVDVSAMQLAGRYYSKAIQHYELARYDDPFSKDILKALLTLSERMDDPSRTAEYTKLLGLARG